MFGKRLKGKVFCWKYGKHSQNLYSFEHIFPYHHKGNMEDKKLMESILRYLTDEDDVSIYFKIVKSDFGEELYHFNIVNVNWYVLNAAWYLLYKIKDAIIVFD